jgi:hypothetical protein
VTKYTQWLIIDSESSMVFAPILLLFFPPSAYIYIFMADLTIKPK